MTDTHALWGAGLWARNQRGDLWYVSREAQVCGTKAVARERWSRACKARADRDLRALSG
ncbi:MAG TPA: hypothetical protein VF463_13330 [Sphingobium sp.]